MDTVNERIDHNNHVISILKSPIIDLPQDYAALESEEGRLERKLDYFNVLFYDLSNAVDDL